MVHCGTCDAIQSTAALLTLHSLNALDCVYDTSQNSLQQASVILVLRAYIGARIVFTGWNRVKLVQEQRQMTLHPLGHKL